MAQFNNAHQSHAHSLQVLNLLKEHDTFMESISSVADMGAGQGLDALWWATATTRDLPAEALDLRVFAVDTVEVVPDFDLPKNLTFINRSFEKRCLPSQVDVIWCHDAFQYAINPLATLRAFNEQMNENGLLYIGLPLLSNHEYGRWQSRAENYQLYNHSFLSMIYMLALNGFDCNDAYFRKAIDDEWLHMVAFKTDKPPLDPTGVSWYDLAELGLLHPSLVNSLRSHGYIRQQDALFPWLDKALYRIDH